MLEETGEVANSAKPLVGDVPDAVDSCDGINIELLDNLEADVACELTSTQRVKEPAATLQPASQQLIDEHKFLDKLVEAPPSGQFARRPSRSFQSSIGAADPVADDKEASAQQDPASLGDHDDEFDYAFEYNSRMATYSDQDAFAPIPEMPAHLVSVDHNSQLMLTTVQEGSEEECTNSLTRSERLCNAASTPGALLSEQELSAASQGSPGQPQQQQQQQQQQVESWPTVDLQHGPVVVSMSQQQQQQQAGEAEAGKLEPASCTEAAAAAVEDPAPCQSCPQEEWEAANQATLEQLHDRHQGAAAAEPLTYPAAAGYFRGLDVSEQRSAVLRSMPKQQHDQQPGSCLRLLFSCAGPPPLSPARRQERLQVLSWARLPLDHAVVGHQQLLAALFLAYTGSPYSVASGATQWSQLGFQGNDPATDLRGCGLLGLLQLLYLHHHEPAAAAALYSLSRSAAQEFPLAIVGMNVTKWGLQALREGGLDSAIERCGDALHALNLHYVGCFYEFYRRWSKGKTMRESGFVLKQLEADSQKQVPALLRQAQRPLVSWR